MDGKETVGSLQKEKAKGEKHQIHGSIGMANAGSPVLDTAAPWLYNNHMKRIWPVLLLLSLFASPAFAVDPAPRITDREIIESLAELKAGQKAMEKRFDDVNRRFYDMQESTNKRFDTLQWMLGLFITIALSLVGIMGRLLWNQQKKMERMETSLETQKDEISFLKTLIEKLLPPKGVL